jgi:hypothetical protein
MKIKLKDTLGITLKTKDTLVTQDIQVIPDATNLIPENIKSGISILGVEGAIETYAGDISSGIVYHTSEGLEIDGTTLVSIGTCTDSCIVVPEGITTIKQYAFQNSPIESIILPQSLTTLGSQSFRNCYKLKEITIPDNVTDLGVQTFSNCISLRSVKLPKNLTD